MGGELTLYVSRLTLLFTSRTCFINQNASPNCAEDRRYQENEVQSIVFEWALHIYVFWWGSLGAYAGWCLVWAWYSHSDVFAYIILPLLNLLRIAVTFVFVPSPYLIDRRHKHCRICGCPLTDNIDMSAVWEVLVRTLYMSHENASLTCPTHCCIE